MAESLTIKCFFSVRLTFGGDFWLKLENRPPDPPDATNQLFLGSKNKQPTYFGQELGPPVQPTNSIFIDFSKMMYAFLRKY